MTSEHVLLLILVGLAMAQLWVSAVILALVKLALNSVVKK